MNSTSIKILLLVLATCLISTVLPRSVQAQGGAGSKGGVVLACFTSDPTKFMVPISNQKAQIYSWPSVTEDPTDARVGYASKTLVFDAVNRLKYVQVAEYYLATTMRSWGGSEDLFANGSYRLHPLLYLINDLPVSKKAVPEPKFPRLKAADGTFYSFPKAKLESPTGLSADEEETLFGYVESEESRIKKDRDLNTPVFAQLYGLVANMFRGVPAFYTRLQAAHEKLGLIPNHEANVWGSNSDQWDSKNISALTSLPKPPENCLWMTAADRIGGDIIYDRYLWHRMDLFQRVLLQLHEEIYYIGSDAKGAGLEQKNVEPTRFLLSHFIRGEREERDLQGDFVSNCARYDTTVSKRTPPVKLIESTACQISNGIDRSYIKGPDSSFLPAAKVGADAVAFVNQFLCYNAFGCSPDLKTWERVARYYGPYSSTALQALLANDQYFFGRYSTIDRLTDKRDRAAAVVGSMVSPYDTIYGFCDKGAYYSSDDVSGPQPPKNNPRRLDRRERERIEKKEENLNYTPRSDEPVIKKSDLEEITFENRVFKDLRTKAGNNLDLQLLAQGLNLLNDFPDKSLSDPIAALLLLKTPASFTEISDLEPGRGGRNIGLIGDVCAEVKERRKKLRDFLKITGTPQEPALTFYERSDDNPLDIKIPR